MFMRRVMAGSRRSTGRTSYQRQPPAPLSIEDTNVGRSSESVGDGVLKQADSDRSGVCDERVQSQDTQRRCCRHDGSDDGGKRGLSGAEASDRRLLRPGTQHLRCGGTGELRRGRHRQGRDRRLLRPGTQHLRCGGTGELRRGRHRQGRDRRLLRPGTQHLRCGGTGELRRGRHRQGRDRRLLRPGTQHLRCGGTGELRRGRHRKDATGGYYDPARSIFVASNAATDPTTGQLSQGGFNWTDATVGGAAGVGAILLLVGAALLGVRHRTLAT